MIYKNIEGKNVEIDKIRPRIIIGIDPGVNTGYAMSMDGTGAILELLTTKIHTAMSKVQALNRCYNMSHGIYCFVEDPNKRVWFGPEKNYRDKAQGAGSVKRDFSIWRDFLEDEDIPMIPVAPKDIATVNHEMFCRLTKWAGKTNEHNRKAGLLVFGK